MPTLFDINVEAIAPSIDSASKKLDKALSFLRFAKKAETLKDGEENIYNIIYDAARISCEAILSVFGYRVKKSSQGHHYVVIDVANRLMEGKLRNEFIRIQKMRKKRNKLEYGDFDQISEQELKQAYADALMLAKAVGKLIEENNPNQNLKLL